MVRSKFIIRLIRRFARHSAFWNGTGKYGYEYRGDLYYIPFIGLRHIIQVWDDGNMLDEYLEGLT